MVELATYNVNDVQNVADNVNIRNGSGGNIGRCGSVRIVVGFTTIYAIGAYHH